MALVPHLDDAILEATETSFELIDAIRIDYQLARSYEPLTQEDWLRVSRLYKLCPREEALRARLGVARIDAVGPDTRLTFNHGHGLHEVLQNRIFAELQRLHGVWECLRCLRTHGSYEDSLLWVVPRPNICDGCQAQPSEEAPGFRYKEWSVEDPKLRLRGSMDGLLRSDIHPGYGVAEFKSIGDTGFKEAKKRPVPAHFIQIQGYMLLAGLKWGRILYWNKSKDGVVGLAEHLVFAHERTQQELTKKIHLTYRCLDAGEIPEGVCESAQCTRADECPVRDACFSEGADVRYGQLRRWSP